MNSIQNAKKIVFSPDTVATNGTNGFMVVDTKDWDYCTIDIINGTAAATTAPTTLSITESDDLTTYTAIEAFTGGAAIVAGTSSFVFPATHGNAAATETLCTFNVNCAARKRYLKANVVTGSSATIIMIANLTRAEQAPTTAATQGSHAVVNG